jgi:hypothetical protein
MQLDEVVGPKHEPPPGVIAIIVLVRLDGTNA